MYSSLWDKLGMSDKFFIYKCLSLCDRYSDEWCGVVWRPHEPADSRATAGAEWRRSLGWPEESRCRYVGGKNNTGAPGDFPPKMQKRALENQKRAPENCHRLQCKSLFNVADLVSGMWKVAPENINIIFGLRYVSQSALCTIHFLELFNFHTQNLYPNNEDTGHYWPMFDFM